MEAGAEATLQERLASVLTPAQDEALSFLRRACEGRGVALFLVGGAVRDLLLGRGHLDLDFAVEGEGTGLALELAAAVGGRAVTHARFGTASVHAQGLTLDLARTRSETYARPGALPAVEPAGIDEDLARRDFRINAMALRLTPPAGELLDPFGGRSDLEARRLRILHAASFQDDATRMLRGVRYAARLDLGFEGETLACLERDLPFLDDISGPRLRHEFALLFEEERAVDGVLLAQSLGVLRAISPVLAIGEGVAARWREALSGRRYAPLEELGFCLLAGEADVTGVESVSRRLHLTGRVERALRDLLRLRAVSPKLTAPVSPATAVELLEDKAPASIWALALLAGGTPARTCLSYLESGRGVKTELNGNDLLALGLPPGPEIGEALRALRRARLDGLATSREDELAFVRSRLAAAKDC